MHPIYPITEKELAHAQQRLGQIDVRIARQRKIVEELATDGHDAAQAKAILDILLETQENCESALRLLRAFRL